MCFSLDWTVGLQAFRSRTGSIARGTAESVCPSCFLLWFISRSVRSVIWYRRGGRITEVRARDEGTLVGQSVSAMLTNRLSVNCKKKKIMEHCLKIGKRAHVSYEELFFLVHYAVKSGESRAFFCFILISSFTHSSTFNIEVDIPSKRRFTERCVPGRILHIRLSSSSSLLFNIRFKNFRTLSVA
jgi:hypothetical protein